MKAAVLRCDYDAGAVVPTARQRRALLRRAGFRVVWSRTTRSPGGHGWHVTLDVRPRPTPLMAVALQAILGSDAWREACNLSRVRVLGRMPARVRQHYNVLYAKVGP